MIMYDICIKRCKATKHYSDKSCQEASRTRLEDGFLVGTQKLGVEALGITRTKLSRGFFSHVIPVYSRHVLDEFGR